MLIMVTVVMVSCKKDLPQLLNPGKYAWIHSYNSSNQSQSFETVESTYMIKIKANGSYKIFEDKKIVNEGVCDSYGGKYSLKLVSETGSDYSFSAEDDRIEVLNYPISNHTNTFIKL